MAIKKTVWMPNGSSREFDTEAEAIHEERVSNVADELLGLGMDARDCAEWILKHFVPKSSAGPQSAYPPKVHGPCAPCAMSAPPFKAWGGLS